MAGASVGHARELRERAAHGVVELDGRERSARVDSAADEDLSIGESRRRVGGAPDVEWRSRGPRARRVVVDLARKIVAHAAGRELGAADDDDVPVRQERRRVSGARDVERSGRNDRARPRVVERGVGERLVPRSLAARDEDDRLGSRREVGDRVWPVGHERRRVAGARRR